MIKPPLSVGYGYGIVLGLGFLFAFGMMLITWILRRYNNELQTSELFSTAGRTVKSGLVASAVVSSWTWAATLLTSSGVAYRYGVSGPLWYASGATVQILWFATLAIELKRRAPNAHTFLEVIRARYGIYTHIVFIVFGLMTNILVTAMLLSGGSAVVTSLTGMPTTAACFLLPVGVVMYTLFGGIKATFLTDYVHTFTILIIIFIFAFTAYATSPILGSPGAVWELLQKAALEHPVAGNAQGSYLTMQSREGIIFFVINIAGNFGTVFCDNVPDVTRFFIYHRIKLYSAPDLQKGYYNKAIAAHPVSALPGYIMGGLSWFAIPWLCATTMGLSALALEGNPAFPTYPNRLSDAQVSAGLVLPNSAVALLGQGGAICTLLMVFMAVTSASSAELIAVSTIFTYDIYQTYFEPEAPGHRLIYVAHASVIGFGIFMAGFATALFYIGISMTYLYLMMGVIVSSAVIPATLTLMWKRQNVVAATATPILGLFCSLTAWLVTAKRESGSLSVASTYANNPMLAGNVVALLSPVLFIPILTYAFGVDNYDYKSMESIRRGDDSDIAAGNIDLELVPGATNPPEVTARDERAMLKHASKTAKATTAGMTLILLILWPIPLYASGYVFSKPFFTGWVVAGIMWLFFSFCCVGLFPLWQGRQGLIATFKAIKLDFNTSREARNPHSDNRRGRGYRESLDLSIDS